MYLFVIDKKYLYLNKISISKSELYVNLEKAYYNLNYYE